MELTSDIYSWLIETNEVLELSLNPKVKVNENSNLIIPKTSLNVLFDALSFEKIVYKIEECFNNLYEDKLLYTKNLKGLRRTQSSNDNLYNWKLISETLRELGIDVSVEGVINMVKSKNTQTLSDLLKTLFTLSQELNKKVKVEEKKHEGLQAWPGRTGREEEKQSHSTGETIVIENINLRKKLNETESVLEFFIVSLGKHFELRPRQCAALLANNRKYLTQIVSNGVNGEYDKVLRWMNDLELNERQRHLVKLVKNNPKRFETNRRMSFSTISVGLYSKYLPLINSTFVNINLLQSELGTDWDWLVQDFLGGCMKAIDRHPTMRTKTIQFLIELVNDKSKEFFQLFPKNFPHEKIYEFLGNIIEIINSIQNEEFKNNLVQFMLDYCLFNSADKAAAFSLLVDFWLQNVKLNEHTSRMIINIYKKSFKENNQKPMIKTVICQLFRLLGEFGRIRHEYAPIIYKLSVQLFDEHFDQTFCKEQFLNSFTLLFKLDPSIPITMIMNPYLDILSTSNSYNMLDLNFLSFIATHPKMNEELMKKMILFLLNLSQKHLSYTRVANEILNNVYNNDKSLLLDPFLVEQFVSFIKKNLKIFLLFPDNPLIVEAPYDIVTLNYKEINSNLEQDVIHAVNEFRKKNGKYSNALLSLLWFFDAHDEVLLQNSELYAERYKKITKRIKKRVERKENANKLKNHTEFGSTFYKEYTTTSNYEHAIEDKLNQEEMKILMEKEKKERIEYLNKISPREEEIQKKWLEKKIELISQKSRKRVKSMQIPTIKKNNNEIDKSQTLILSEDALYDNHMEQIKEKEKERHLLKRVELLNFEEEEERDKTAIDLCCKQFNPNLKYFFNNFPENSKDEFIQKAAVLKMIRSVGISQEFFTHEDFNSIIRQYFGLPLVQFNFNQFTDLVIQSSNLAYTKINSNLCPGEKFLSFCNLLEIPILRKDDLLYKLKEKLSINPNMLIPPGFKKKTKLKLNYQKKIPNFMINFLGEEKTIVLEILDEILNKEFGIHILESFITQSKEVDIVPVPVFNNDNNNFWRPEISLAFSDLNPELEKEGIESGYILEEVLRLSELGKKNHQDKIINLKQARDELQFKMFMESEKQKEEKRILRHQFIKNYIKVEKANRKELESTKQEQLKKLKEEMDAYLKIQAEKENELKKSLRRELLKAKKEREIEIQKKEDDENAKKKAARLLRVKESNEMVLNQKKKLIEEFKGLVLKSYEFKKSSKIGLRLPNLSPKPAEKILKQKQYNEFEHELNNILTECLKLHEIKAIFDKYEDHINTIYNVFSNQAFKVIGHIEDQCIHYSEFYQFCHVFTILGLLINPDQVNFIFHKISRYEKGVLEEKNFIKKDGFKLALLYIAIMSTFEKHKDTKILPKHIKELNPFHVQCLFDFMRLKIPFEASELTSFINDRKSLNIHQLNKVVSESLDIVDLIRPEDNEKKKQNLRKSVTGAFLNSHSPIRSHSNIENRNLKNDTPLNSMSMLQVARPMNPKIETINAHNTNVSSKDVKKNVTKTKDSKNLNVLS